MLSKMQKKLDAATADGMQAFKAGTVLSRKRHPPTDRKVLRRPRRKARSANLSCLSVAALSCDELRKQKSRLINGSHEVATESFATA